jgi:hypothetical protein
MRSIRPATTLFLSNGTRPAPRQVRSRRSSLILSAKIDSTEFSESTESRKARMRSPSPPPVAFAEPREKTATPVRSVSRRAPERERVAHPQARETPLPSRDSDATQSMLLRSVAMQAEAATAALKQATPPPAPSTPDRKTSLLRRKSSKAVRQGISSPQLVSSSSNMRTVDLPTQPVATPPSATSSPPVSRPTTRHVRKQSSTSGLRFKVFGKGKGIEEGSEETSVEPSRDSSPESTRTRTSSVPTSPAAGSTMSHSPTVNHNHGAHGAPSGSGLSRLMSKLRRRGNLETEEALDRHAEEARQQTLMLRGYRPPTTTAPPAISEPLPDQVPIQLSRQVSASKAPSSYVAGIGGFAGSRARRAALQGDPVHPPVPPLVISPRKAPPKPVESPASPSSIGDYESRTNSNARSIDSMRKLWEAANDLGLDPDKVDELVRLSQPKGFEDGDNSRPGSHIVRRSVIIPSASPSQPGYSFTGGGGGPSGYSHSRSSSLAATGSDPDRLSPRSVVHRRTSSEASVSGRGEPERCAYQERAASPSLLAPKSMDRLRERPALAPIGTSDRKGCLGPGTPSSARSNNLQVASSPGLMPPSPSARSARSSVASYEASIFECV